jgi:acyl-CoA thioester hydrolase
MPKPVREPPPRIDQFPCRIHDVIRFGDMDRQGHVNNAVFSTYLETGRVGIMHHETEGLQVPGATTVLARLELDFLKELRWPGTVEVGTAVAEIGRCSYTLRQAVFHDGTCAAAARAVLVLIDRETRRARPLPPDLVDRLKRWMPGTET